MVFPVNEKGWLQSGKRDTDYNISNGRKFKETSHSRDKWRCFGLSQIYFPFPKSVGTNECNVVSLGVNFLDKKDEISRARIHQLRQRAEV